MKRCLGLFLLLCAGMFHSGSGLNCYKCSGKTRPCKHLYETDGTTFRGCSTDANCKIGDVTHHCCNSDQCPSVNAVNAVTVATPALALAGSLLSVWWCWH